MFVRYRRIRSDGFKPDAVDAAQDCAGGCRERRYRYCPMKPRCRWRIGLNAGIGLVPHRLQVSIVESRRENGRVRQDHVADLASTHDLLKIVR